MNLNEWAIVAYQIAADNGFHSSEPDMAVFCANLHGEISELWEAYRKKQLDKSCDKLESLTCLEEEIADIILRTLDTAQTFGIDIENAVHTKCEYNRTRPYRHGNKIA